MGIAIVRFYEELNDYLPKIYHKKEINYTFNSGSDIKEMINFFNIPPEKIDFIIVNGNSQGYDYVLKDLDFVSIYPAFESFDISEVQPLHKKPLRNLIFICDSHLGKLCKYMRMLGFDTLYFNNISKSKIIDISIKEKRIIVTRNYKLIKDCNVSHIVLIKSDNAKEQILEIISKLDLSESIEPFTRCLKCNEIIESIEKQDIYNLLPEKTKKYFDHFYICKNCNKIYWEGSHYENMLKFINSISHLNL